MGQTLAVSLDTQIFVRILPLLSTGSYSDEMRVLYISEN